MLRRAPALFVAMLVAACSGPDLGGTWDKVKARGELVWGADVQGGEPYVFEKPGDPSVHIGFEVDIMEALAKRLGVRQRMVQFNWSNLIQSLERGDFDMTMNGIEATPERAAHVLLSRPYYVYGETLAVRAGSRFHSLADLSGRPVATLNQSVAYDILRANPVELRIYEGVEEPYADLLTGRVDGVLLDDVIADRYGCNKPGISCLPGDLARGVYVACVRREDPELRDAIDKALAAMQQDGELERILRRWDLWNHRQSEPPPPMPKQLRVFDGEQMVLFLEAAWVTLQVSLLAFLLAVPLGLMLAIGRVYGGLPVRIATRVYIELFRGTPVLLQLFVLYYGLAPYWDLDPMAAAVLGLGLNYAAYEAEVYRGAILAIPRGQTEASKALGLGPWQSLWYVLIPQAVTIALPPMTNDFVSLLKDSSLISVITVIELTKRMTIAAVDLQGWLVPGLACAALYLALSFPLSELGRRLERKLSRDQRPRTL
ncbi:MAG: ABC transporter substrate-binding protein/permease [Myxococcota bacterium]